ncbi:hypothetical protein Cch01nite_15310 [Cellulomonas chitinilytica]|uniref:O-antigen ligase-related domain-containing protein n=1 Tax=Cellulomonas chitinilytica TaxID=398759 RepID=A0A919P289_9CELL|nr:hypothetical protein Cch01nite_15310 [Cellulomonas chitinilytica]
MLPFGLSRFVLPKLAVVAVAVALAALARPVGRLRRDVAVVVVVGAGWLVLCALAGDAPLAQLVGRWPRYEGLVALPLYAGALWAGARLLGPGTTPARTRALVGSASVTALVCALVALVEATGRRPLGGDVTRPGSLLGNASQQGALGATLLAVLLAVVVRRPVDRAAALPTVGLVASGTLVVTSGSRAALAGAVLACGVVVLTGWRAPGRRRTLAVAGGAAVAVGAAALLLPTTRDRVLGGDELASGTVEGRALLWSDTVRLLGDHLVTGVGPSGFFDAAGPAASDRWRLELGTANPPDSPHDALLQAGVAGGAVLVVLTLALVALLVRAGWAARGELDGPRGGLLAGAAAGLVAGVVTLSTGFTHASTTPLLCVLAGALASQVAAERERAWVGPAVAAGGAAWALVLVVACAGEGAVGRGVTLAAEGHIDAASDRFDLARTLRPWDADVPVLATAAFAAGVDAGDPASARHALSWSHDALALVPGSVDTVRTRAVALATLDRPAEGRVLVERVLADDPLNVDLLLAAGTLAAQDGDLEAGRDHLVRATEVDPGNAAAWADLGIVAQAMGDTALVAEVRAWQDAHPSG